MIVVTFMSEPPQAYQGAAVFEEFDHGLVVDRIGQIAWDDRVGRVD